MGSCLTSTGGRVCPAGCQALLRPVRLGEQPAEHQEGGGRVHHQLPHRRQVPGQVDPAGRLHALSGNPFRRPRRHGDTETHGRACLLKCTVKVFAIPSPPLTGVNRKR